MDVDAVIWDPVPCAPIERGKRSKLVQTVSIASGALAHGF